MGISIPDKNTWKQAWTEEEVEQIKNIAELLGGECTGRISDRDLWVSAELEFAKPEYIKSV